MKYTTPLINLFRTRKKTFFDKFITWALTIGRLLVIFTEGIALAAFLYRFSLDRQLIDLHENIKRKKIIIEHFKTNEDKYRNLQERLALISRFQHQAEDKTQFLYDILQLTPPDMILSTLSFTDTNIAITANTQSASSLSSFIKSLKDYPQISAVSLNTIENKISSGLLIVSITATIGKHAN